MTDLRLRLRLARHLAVALFTLPFFLWPGLMLVRDLADPAMAGPGIPARAHELHARLSEELVPWARERIATGRAASAPLHDVPTTEWPMFSAVFYLMATENLVNAWESAGGEGESPMVYARPAVDAAKDLILDPSHHTWVRTHWGEDYLHQENVFFRGLLIAGLTSYHQVTGDHEVLPTLRDQVRTLSDELDASPLGLLDDYPGECYPIDVVATIAFIRHSDRSTGFDSRAFVARSLRAFEGERLDELGLVPFRVDLSPDRTVAWDVQPGRGIGSSWIAMFTAEAYGLERSQAWYAIHEAHFWQHQGWAEGFREWRRGSEAEWGFEIDAGPVIDGFGTAASAFGIGAARAHGRFDHAYSLSGQMAAASWTLPDGTLLLPRLVSHAADAPYLGEAGILYFLTVQPHEELQRSGTYVAASEVPPLAKIGVFVFFGFPALAWWQLVRTWRRIRVGARAASTRRPVVARPELA
ncbi:MAG: hypothetical protein MUE69_20735 [Myxococcota bacterium]|jgi:hypothetical protein|nr:hypothetical protein [Myxococcota bacterium]